MATRKKVIKKKVTKRSPLTAGEKQSHAMYGEICRLLSEGRRVEVRERVNGTWYPIRTLSDAAKRKPVEYRVSKPPKYRPLDVEVKLLVGKRIQRRDDPEDVRLVLGCHQEGEIKQLCVTVLNSRNPMGDFTSSSQVMSITVENLLAQWELVDSNWIDGRDEWLEDDSRRLGVEVFEEEDDDFEDDDDL